MLTQMVSPPTFGASRTQRSTQPNGGFSRQVASQWPGVLVVLGRAVQVLVDADQAGVVGVAARHRMVLQRAEPLAPSATCSARLIC